MKRQALFQKERARECLKKTLSFGGFFAVFFVMFSVTSPIPAHAAYPVISDVTVSNITAQGATVSWTTDIPSNSLVDFGTSTSYGTTLGDQDEAVTEHSVVLTGLFPLTTHYFQVRSSNGGDETVDDNGGVGYTVATTAAPVISNVRVTSVTDNTATITFQTDIDAYPYVGYGLTDTLGNLVGDEENFGTTHSIALYGLTPGQQYYFKPRVGDIYQNYTYYSENNLFTTSGPYLQSITTTVSDGTYGPGDQIPIVATFQEDVVSGSANVTVTLNTGVSIDLNQVTDNTVTGLYVVGSTGSGQNISSLAVSEITYQNVCDSDGFCYRGTTLPSENINENSTVAVDTTAPVFSDISPSGSWPYRFNNITTSSDISYTLSEELSSGSITLTRTSGSSDPGSPHTCTLTGTALSFGEHDNFNMTNCQEGVPTLVDGAIYTIRFSGADLVGNNASTTERTNMHYDITAPSITSFTSSTPDGTYGAGSSITIVANFDESPNVRGSMRAILDTGVEVELNYNGTENVVRGTYTVGDIGSGEASDDLTVTQISYMNIRDLAGNTTTDTTLPASNLGDNSDIVIDTETADLPSLVEFQTDPVNSGNESNVTLRVEGETNTTIHYSIDDNNGSTPAVTGTMAMDGDGSTDITGIDLSGLADGTITAQVQLEKTNGEFSSFAQGMVTKDTDAPGWYMQYYADSGFSQSLGDNPQLKAGTYYIRIAFWEGEGIDDSAPTPNISIDAQGTANDVTDSPIERISSNVYRYERTIVYDASADGTMLEDLVIDSLTDVYGNTATNINPYYESTEAAYNDTVKPTVTGNVSPEYAQVGMVDVALEFSEIMDTSIAPTVRLRKSNGGFISVSGSYTGSTTWTGAAELLAGDSNGPADLQVLDAEDEANNEMDADEDVFDFYIDTQNPSVSINLGTDAHTGPVQTDTINLTAIDTGSGVVTRQYGFSTDYTCNSGDSYDYTFQDSVSFDITGDETRFLCAKVVDRADNTAYQLIGELDVDNTAPTIHSVTSDTTNGSYKAGDTVEIRVNFTEAVTSTGSVEVLLETGATDRSCTMSVYESNHGTCDYVVQAGDTSSDLNEISVSGTVHDLAGNELTNFTPGTSLMANKNIIIDTTAPVIDILSPVSGDFVSGSTVVFFSDNEPTLSQCSFDGSTWTNCATGATSLQLIEGWDDLGEGEVTLYVRDTDLAGNIGTDAESGIVKDTNFPVVSDVTADKLSGYYNAGTDIPIVVTFSRAVTSNGNVIVTLETGTTDRSCTFTITDDTEARCTYTVQNGDTSGDLDVISVAGDIEDSVGNELSSTTPVVNLSDNKDIVIDTTPPTISSVNSTHSNGTFGVGEEIDVTTTFSEPVSSSSVTVNLDSGGDCSFFASENDSGTCLYTVAQGENSLDLTTSSISGTIEDRAGNAMVNFSPGINLGANKNIKIDTTSSGPPTVESVVTDADDGSYTVDEEIPVTVNFSETVVASGPVTVTFETGSIDRTCSIEASSLNNSTSGSCTYTVREGDVSSDLAVSSITGNVYDVVNNQMISPASPAINISDLKNIVIDTTAPAAPTVALTSPITDVNKTGVSLSGTGEANASISYSIDDANALTSPVTGTGTVSSGGDINISAIDVTGLDGGTLTALVSLTDAAGNAGSAGTATATSQILLPVISSITSDSDDGHYALGETIDVRVNFSENVTSSGDVTVVLETGMTDRSCTFAVSNSSVGVCNYTIQAGDEASDLNVKFVSGEVYDQADNPMVNFGISSNLADNKDIVIDTVVPSAPVITLTDPITDANRDSVVISGTGEANTTISYTIDDENVETSAITGTGTVDSGGNILIMDIDLTGLDGGTITATATLSDEAGNESDPGTDTATSEVAMPTIVSIASDTADGYYNAGDTIDVRVNFSENVTSSGDITLTFETGETDATCVFSIDDADSAVCSYVIASGENTSDLDVIDISGDIADQGGNPVISFIPTTTLAESSDIVVDTINVSLAGFHSDSDDGTYGPNETISLYAQYSESLDAGSEVSVLLDTGANVTLNTISPEDDTLLTGTYTIGSPGSGEGSSDLRVNAILSQNVCDFAENCLTETAVPGTNINNNSEIVVDAVSPEFSDVLPENSTNIDSVTENSDISYTLSEDIVSGSIVFTRTAWNADPNSPHTCTLTGDALLAGEHSGFDTSDCASGAISLVEGTVYSVAFNAEDAYGNPADEVLKTGVSYGLDVTAPVISNVSVDEITSVSATITWETDENADSFVDFGESSYTDLRGNSSDLDTEHSIVLDGLSPGTDYIFRVRSTDGTQNEAEDDNGGSGYSFTTLNLPSVVSTEVTDITFESATISWEIDTPVYSYLAYGETESYGYAVGDESNLMSEQSVSLENLEDEQIYYYRIKIRDVYGNITFSDAYTFTTAEDGTDNDAPIISDVSVSNISGNAATFTWTTDEAADSYVEYGTTEDYGEIYGSGTSTTDHSIVLPAILDPLTTYQFRVVSSDANGNEGVSENQSFTTTEEAAEGDGSDGTGEDGDGSGDSDGSGDGDLGDPDEEVSVSNVEASRKSSSSMVITWETNKPTNGMVRYGLDEEYGSAAAEDISLTSTEDFTEEHEVTISGLFYGSAYHYQVVSNDAFGNIGTSDDETFTTPDLVSVSGVNVSNITLNAATITWETGDPVTTQIDYGKTTSYGESIETEEISNYHKVELENLDPDTTYHFRVGGQRDDESRISSDDYVFATYPKPEVKGYSVEAVSDSSATVSWETNIPAESMVSYVNPEDPFDNGTQGSSEVANQHNVEVLGLKQGTNYQFRIKGIDVNKNTFESDVFDVKTDIDLTPPTISFIKSKTSMVSQSEEVIQAIISWKTDEASSSQLLFDVGMGGEDFSQQTKKDENLTTNHVVVLTDLRPGSVYRFKAISEDKNGNEQISNIFSFLTPRKEKSVFQLIIDNFEETFGWVRSFNG